MSAKRSRRKASADDKHEKRKELSSGKRTGQRRVWLAKQFAGDAHDGVKNEEAPGCHAIRFLEFEANYYQEGKEQEDLPKMPRRAGSGAVA